MVFQLSITLSVYFILDTLVFLKLKVSQNAYILPLIKMSVKAYSHILVIDGFRTFQTGNIVSALSAAFSLMAVHECCRTLHIPHYHRTHLCI